MRIAMCYHYFWPHRGGIENAMGNLAGGLVKLGHEVSVITSDIGETKTSVRPVHETIDGIKIMRLPGGWMPARAMALKGLKKAIGRLEADVWHAHHPSPLVADKFIGYCKDRKLPSVLSYHADGADEGAFDRTLASCYYGLIGNRMLSSAGRIIAHSRSYMRSSPWLKHHEKEVNIIPLGIDPAEFTGADGGKFRKMFRLDGKKVVCSLGRLVPYKGYEYLIKAIPLMGTDWMLLLGGTGPEEFRLKKLASELGLKDKVVFTGRINESDKKHFYAAGDVFSLPSVSRGEAFGVSILEALAVGKPAVISDIPGPRDIKGAITVKPRDPAALAKAIEGVEGKKGKLDSAYHINNVAKRTAELYGKMI